MSKTSAVWDYFDDVPNKREKACCKIHKCPGPRELTIGVDQSTKGLWTHLKTKHPDQHKAAKAKSNEGRSTVAASASQQANIYSFATATGADVVLSGVQKQMSQESDSSSVVTASFVQPKITDIFHSIDKYKPGHPKQKEITYLIGEWLCDATAPFVTVNNLCFQAVMEAAHPKYKVPSDWYFRNVVIPDIHNRVKQKIQQIVLMEIISYSATTDMWSSETAQSYISLTIHFISSTWQRKILILSCQPFFNSHSAENISACLHSILSEWEINEKIHVFMRDLASNIVAAMRAGDFVGVPCFLHTLQLVVQAGLLSQRAISDMMTRLQNCIAYFRNSNVAKEKCIQAQQQMGLPKHSLILGEKTRWSSYAKSLERALEQQRAIRDASGELNIGPEKLLVSNDWKLMEQVSSLLQPFAEVTNFGEREDACISEIIPTLFKLTRQLSRLDPHGAHTMKDELENQLKKYFRGEGGNSHHRETFPSVEYFDVYAIATLLDPRFKRKLFMDPTAAENAQEKLEELVFFQLKEKRETVSITINEPMQKRVKMGGYFSDLADDLAAVSSVPSATSVATDEANEEALQRISKNNVSQYLQESLINPDSTPLDYWKMKEIEMPELCFLAKKYLSPPMGTAASEREFKIASDITSGSRIKLLPENAERLLFLKCNLRAIGYNSLRLPFLSDESPSSGSDINENEALTNPVEEAQPDISD